MRIITDDKGWCHDLIWRDTWIGTHDKECCLVQNKVLCEFDSMWQEVSWPIWSTMWNKTEDRRWCHDLIWGALWIGRDMKECSHVLIWSATWIGNYVTGSFHDEFELLCGL
jgi:hypothetical protein